MIHFILFPTSQPLGVSSPPPPPPPPRLSGIAAPRLRAGKHARSVRLPCQPGKQTSGAMWHLPPTFQDLLSWKVLPSVVLSPLLVSFTLHPTLISPSLLSLSLSLSLSHSLLHLLLSINGLFVSWRNELERD